MYSNNWYYNKVQQQQQQQQQSGGSVQVPVAGGGSMNDSYESQFQVIERDPFSGNVRKIEEKREQHSKRTTQTTTTTTSTSQPMLLNTADLQGPTVASVSPVHFADSHAHLTYVQQPVPVYAIATGPCLPIPVVFIYDSDMFILFFGHILLIIKKIFYSYKKSSCKHKNSNNIFKLNYLNN